MNILKKQGVAWAATILMIAAAVGIGKAKSPAMPSPWEPGNDIVEIIPPDEDVTLVDFVSVYDEADVISAAGEQNLQERNADLMSNFNSMIAVVTVNESAENLGQFALDYADSIGLSASDFIVVLDISGDNYWLVQGAGLVDVFTDQDCSDYAWDYMENDFALGYYEDAVLNLVDGLADWYYDNWRG